MADVFYRLFFRKVAVHATSVSLLTHMHIGIMGTMAQMALADLDEKTKRGQLGRAAVAFSTGPRAPAPTPRQSAGRE